MTRSSDELILPYDILHYVLNLLPLKDRLALSSISRATRTATLIPCFSSFCVKIQDDDNSKARSALKNASLAFRKSIKEIHTASFIHSPWSSSFFEVLSSLPNLHSISCDRSLRLSQLVTFLDAVKHKPIRSLSIRILTDVAIPAIAGLPDLETLSITWVHYSLKKPPPAVDLNLCDFITGLIQPSIDTLRDLRLDFSDGKDQDGAALNWELLKQAKLQTFLYSVTSTNTDVITQLPGNLAHVKKLSLLWKSWPGDGQPSFDKSFITYFAQLPCLTHLTLCLDLENEANDLMKFSHDMAWYNRSLHRRLRASELLAKQCLALERIDWVQLGIDSEGNDMGHTFMVEETSDSGRGAKTVMDWWMEDYFYNKERHGGPLPDLIKRESYFDY